MLAQVSSPYINLDEQTKLTLEVLYQGLEALEGLYQAVVKYRVWIRTQVSWTQIRHRPRRSAAEEEQEDVDGPDLVLEQLLHRQAVLVVAT